MQHLDEHTLALFALGADHSLPEREAITAHLATCGGCRAQFEELCQINDHVSESLSGAPLDHARKMTELVPARSLIPSHIDASAVRARDRRTGSLVRLAGFARRHPGGTASLALMAALALVLTVNEVQRKGAGAPADMRRNERGRAIEIIDQAGMHLWDVPVHDGEDAAASEARWGNSLTRIVDLDGDGHAGVVTGESYADGENLQMNIIRFYNSRGSLLAHTTIGHATVFRGDIYPMFFRVTGVVTVKSPSRPSMDIFAGATSNRSPYVVTRVDNTGAIVGEYWHYGWMPAIAGVQLEGTGNKVLVMCGVNDVGDKADSGYAAIAILDPSRIEGRTESSACRGFGYAASDAELYYVKAEVPRLPFRGDSTIHVGNFRFFKVAQDSSLIFTYQSGTGSGLPSYTYTFDHSMHLMSVSFDNISRQVLQEKYLRDNSATVLDRYRRTLEEGVRFWDGERWRKTTAKVGQSVAAAR